MTTTTLIMMRTAITVTRATVGRAVVVVGDKFMLPVGNLEAALIQLREAANEIRSCGMKLFAPLVLLAILFASAIAQNAQFISPDKTFNGPDRTITWRSWQQNVKDEFRFRTGDRYLGRAVWEHYLGFEQHRPSSKAIKLSMIRLRNEDAGGEAVLRPGSRYAIFKVTNGTMTARKGVWSWTAQDVR
jgi:hypothetical protein